MIEKFEDLNRGQDVSDMVNKIFEADSLWLMKMCEEELKQRDNLIGVDAPKPNGRII